MRRSRRHQQGQSTFEYAVACAAIALALGLGMIGPDSPLGNLLDRLRQGYQRYAFAMSLPG